MSRKPRISGDIAELVGKTPMVYLNRMRNGRPGVIAAKLECTNPSGSTKDRAVLFMLHDAENRGHLKPGTTVVESTSGNTGISLAAFAARRGYRAVITMPETANQSRLRLMRAYGAEVVLTPAQEGMRGAITKAQEIHENTPGSYMLQQFMNPSNPKSHLKTTAKEIWQDTGGTVRAVVAGIGTGGTISGIGRALKRLNPEVRIIGVEPEQLAVLSQGEKRYETTVQSPGVIDGIGAGFIPRTLDRTVVDEVIAITDEDAIQTTRTLARTEGLLGGPSSGAAIWAALQIADREEYREKLIVVICPDNGLKYIGTELFE